MTASPELMLHLAYDHQRELVAEADRARVLSKARRQKRAAARHNRQRAAAPNQ